MQVYTVSVRTLPGRNELKLACAPASCIALTATLRALGNENRASAENLIARVRAGAVAPVVFGAYTDLVEAIFSDDIEAAEKIAEELCAPGFGRTDGLRIVTLNDRHLGTVRRRVIAASWRTTRRLGLPCGP